MATTALANDAREYNNWIKFNKKNTIAVAATFVISYL